MNSLQWKKYPVLNDGFICLVDSMGTDASICQAARVSYGNDKREGSETETEVEQTRKDTDLLRLLLRHGHTTPFEMVEIKFLVRIPMDCWRQWIRHRTANVNEYSTRYREAIDSQQTTTPELWRLQATDNKQGSSGYIDPITGRELSADEKEYHGQSRYLYNRRLAAGVAKEQARKDLPLSTYTEAYWKCDLHNIFNFLRLRMDSHAQLEIRSYANAMAGIVKQLFPVSWQAFEDYQLNSMKLTAKDIEVAVWFAKNKHNASIWKESVPTAFHELIPNKREREECVVKLTKLGIL